MVLKPFSFSITWEFVRNANSLVQDRIYQIRNPRTLICLDIALCGILIYIKFWEPWVLGPLENHCEGFRGSLFPSTPNGSWDKAFCNQWHMAGQELRLDVKTLRVILCSLFPTLLLTALLSTSATKLSPSGYSLLDPWSSFS